MRPRRDCGRPALGRLERGRGWGCQFEIERARRCAIREVRWRQAVHLAVLTARQHFGVRQPCAAFLVAGQGRKRPRTGKSELQVETCPCGQAVQNLAAFRSVAWHEYSHRLPRPLSRPAPLSSAPSASRSLLPTSPRAVATGRTGPKSASRPGRSRGRENPPGSTRRPPQRRARHSNNWIW